MTGKRKADSRLEYVLYTRVDDQLRKEMQAWLAEENAKLDGTKLSMSDLVRIQLWEAVKRRTSQA